MTENEKARQKLQDEFRKLFQFDVSDLDFGIYRILNRKKDQIEEFIEQDLLNAVAEGLKEYQNLDKSELEDIKQQIIENLADDAFDENGNLVKYANTKLGQDYIKALDKHKKGQIGADTEKKIFNDLYIFFSRYFEDGDFVTKRRISTRNPKYAIPYNGEEVLLHWANKDQYYIKTGEHFSNYKFDIDNKSVWFKVSQAETEKDNVKESDTRYFVLRPENTLEINDEDNELIIWFEYRTLTDEEEAKFLKIYNDIEKPRKTLDRQTLCVAYDKWIRDQVKKEWRDILSVSELNKDRSLLYYKLNHYTGKNSTDYFIHKDLKTFLERELEFYLKNEVIRIDDFIEDETDQSMEITLIRAKVVRVIANKIIEFLSQIENFQKKLFEKKKFVVDTHYCFTLDRVPKELYDTILKNRKQLEHWEELYAMNKWNGELQWDSKWTKSFLEKHPYMMVDTKWFDEDFKYELLTSCENLDNTIDGININGDNIHTLNLLKQKFTKMVGCIHIDPPYNTETSGFLYKNNYKHSSWLSMMKDRIEVSLKLLNFEGGFQCHIDENEQAALQQLLDQTDTFDIGTIIWDKKNPMLGKKGIATQHEYILWRSKTQQPMYMRNKNVVSILEKVKDLIDEGGGVNKNTRRKFANWLRSQNHFSGGEKAYNLIDDKGRVYQSVGMGAPEPRTNPKFYEPLIHPKTGKECPVPDNGWSRSPETLKKLIENEEIIFGEDETKQPRKKVFLKPDYRRQVSSLLEDAKSGKHYLDPLELMFPYSHPVSLYEELIASSSKAEFEWVLDYFAGSGTTAHAVLNLNREDNGNRNYILVEMGDYFDSVLIPRIQKIVFTNNWKDGIPQDQDGQSHAFKYHFIESYEDALNNIDFKDPGAVQQAMKFDDYTISYMLDFETQGVSPTLLTNGAFDSPFDYKLYIQRGHESPKKENVDLIETFHYLIGLWVQKIHRFEHQGRKYIVSIGQIEDEDSLQDVCIIWRNINNLDLDQEAEWIEDEIIKN